MIGSVFASSPLHVIESFLGACFEMVIYPTLLRPIALSADERPSPSPKKAKYGWHHGDAPAHRVLRWRNAIRNAVQGWEQFYCVLFPFDFQGASWYFSGPWWRSVAHSAVSLATSLRKANRFVSLIDKLQEGSIGTFGGVRAPRT